MPVGVLPVMDRDALDVVDRTRGGSISLRVGPGLLAWGFGGQIIRCGPNESVWEHRYAEGGRVKPEYRAWSHSEWLGLPWFLVFWAVVIVVLLFILFSNVR